MGGQVLANTFEVKGFTGKGAEGKPVGNLVENICRLLERLVAEQVMAFCRAQHGRKLRGRQITNIMVNPFFPPVDRVQVRCPNGVVLVGEFSGLFDVHLYRNEIIVELFGYIDV